ncbi:unnamed protein product, partial [Polarella glacialis]
ASGSCHEEIYEDGYRCHQRIVGAHAGAVTAICVALDAVYTVSRDEVLKRWEPQMSSTNCFELTADLEVPLGGECWSLLHVGDWIFCGLADGRIRAFSKSGGEMTMAKHAQGVSAMIVHMDVLITGSAEGIVRCWTKDEQTGAFANTHSVKDLITSQVRCLTVMGDQLWIGGQKGVTVVDLASLSGWPPRVSVAHDSGLL